MPTFAPQPSLPPSPPPAPALPPPPGRSGASAAGLHAGVPHGRGLRSEAWVEFVVVGVDHRTGEPVSITVEARSEDHAQELALRRGVTVQEFRAVPRTAAGSVEAAASGATGAGAGRPTMGEPGLKREEGGAGWALPSFGGRTGLLGIGLVLAVVLGLLGRSVLDDDGLLHLAAVLVPTPAAAEASIDVTAPLEIDWSRYEWSSALAALERPNHRPGEALRLEAVVPPTRGHRGAAVIGGQVVEPGQRVAGYRLIAVRGGHVVLERDGKLVALRMDRGERVTAAE